ncbi:MAG: hypothetical protein H6670_04845 [Anaerolineaceae bacterium]|nr:hypothetical protein [Anaerolineaceae bacterium]
MRKHQHKQRSTGKGSTRSDSLGDGLTSEPYRSQRANDRCPGWHSADMPP